MPPITDRQQHLTFWRHARQGEFWVPRCLDCRTHVFYPRAVCPNCTGVRFSWTRLADDGAVVFSHTTVHVAPARRFAAELPYVLGLVDYPCGVRVLARLRAGDLEQDLCGHPVRMLASGPRDGVYFDVLDQLDRPALAGPQQVGAP
jgi:uncharacterized OB-fold protein